MRATCYDCVLKHLGQASALMDEAANGYPSHKHFAIGHLAEAEAEIMSSNSSVAATIRGERKRYIDGEEVFILTLIEIVEEARAIHNVSSSDERPARQPNPHAEDLSS